MMRIIIYLKTILLVLVVCLDTNRVITTVLADNHDGHSSSMFINNNDPIGSNTNVVRIYTAINSNSSSSNSNNETSSTTNNDPRIESNNNVARIYTAVKTGNSSNNNISNNSITELHDWNHTVSCDLSSTKNNVQVIQVPFQFQIQSYNKLTTLDVRDLKTMLLTDLAAEYLHHCDSKYSYEEIVGENATHFADYNGERVYSISIDPLTGKQIINIYDHNGNRRYGLRRLDSSTTFASSSVYDLYFNEFLTKQDDDVLISDGVCSSNSSNEKEMFCSIYNSSINLSLMVNGNQKIQQVEAAVQHLMLDTIEYFILRGMYNGGIVNSNIVSIEYLSMEEDESSDKPESKLQRVFWMGFGAGIGSSIGVLIVLVLGIYCICKRHKRQSYPNNIEYGTSLGLKEKDNDHEYDIEEQNRNENNHDEPRDHVKKVNTSSSVNNDIDANKQTTRNRSEQSQNKKQQSVSFYNDLVSLPSAQVSGSGDDDDIDGDGEDDNDDDHSGRTSRCTDDDDDDDDDDDNDNSNSSDDDDNNNRSRSSRCADDDDHDSAKNNSSDRSLGVIDILDEEQPTCSMLSSRNSEDDDYHNSRSMTNIYVASSQRQQEETTVTANKNTAISQKS